MGSCSSKSKVTPTEPVIEGYLVTPRLIRSTNEAKAVCGIACIGDDVIVVRSAQQEVEIYDVKTFTLQRRLPVDKLRSPCDMAASERNNSVYILDNRDNCVIRADITANRPVFPWSLDTEPVSLHVTKNYRPCVFVTFKLSFKVQEYTHDGHLVREIIMQKNVLEHPLHTVQLPSGQLAVSHERPHHRVCTIDIEGRVVQSFGSARGSARGEVDGPSYLLVDDRGYSVVADKGNNRVLLLSPTLTFVSELITPVHKLNNPYRMCLDESRGLLYVAEVSGGKVFIFKVKP